MQSQFKTRCGMVLGSQAPKSQFKTRCGIVLGSQAPHAVSV